MKFAPVAFLAAFALAIPANAAADPLPQSMAVTCKGNGQKARTVKVGESFKCAEGVMLDCPHEGECVVQRSTKEVVKFTGIFLEYKLFNGALIEVLDTKAKIDPTPAAKAYYTCDMMAEVWKPVTVGETFRCPPAKGVAGGGLHCERSCTFRRKPDHGEAEVKTMSAPSGLDRSFAFVRMGESITITSLSQ